mgnify:CR=1 FL=1
MIIEVIVIGGLILFFTWPVTYTPYEADGFSCEIPAGAAPEIIEQFGWKKHRIKKKGIILRIGLSVTG